MVAFLVILYSVYLFALIVFGVLLPHQVLPGDDHLSVTIVPAAIAGGGDPDPAAADRAAFPATWSGGSTGCERHPRLHEVRAPLAALPATLASGVRTAIDHVRNPRSRARVVRGRDRLLGGQHRDPVGGVPGVRRATCPLGVADPGLLRRDGGQPGALARPPESVPWTPG